jgi:hypothetical protein
MTARSSMPGKILPGATSAFLLRYAFTIDCAHDTPPTGGDGLGRGRGGAIRFDGKLLVVRMLAKALRAARFERELSGGGAETGGLGGIARSSSAQELGLGGSAGG